MLHQMKTTTLTIATLLTGMAAATAQAGNIKPLHSCARAGTSTVANAASATRVHIATCPAGTVYYEAKVRD